MIRRDQSGGFGVLASPYNLDFIPSMMESHWKFGSLAEIGTEKWDRSLRQM